MVRKGSANQAAAARDYGVPVIAMIKIVVMTMTMTIVNIRMINDDEW